MTETELRRANADDYDALGALMFAAIHDGPTQYSKAQSLAWAPEPRAGTEWAARLDGKDIIVADRLGTLLGFMTIEPGGYIDFAYIRPEAQGTGLFRRLFDCVDAIANARSEPELSTHASLMAQPAFAAMGFAIAHHEVVEVSGQQLARAYMIKPR